MGQMSKSVGQAAFVRGPPVMPVTFPELAVAQVPAVWKRGAVLQVHASNQGGCECSLAKGTSAASDAGQMQQDAVGSDLYLGRLHLVSGIRSHVKNGQGVCPFAASKCTAARVVCLRLTFGTANLCRQVEKKGQRAEIGRDASCTRSQAHGLDIDTLFWCGDGGIGNIFSHGVSGRDKHAGPGMTAWLMFLPECMLDAFLGVKLLQFPWDSHSRNQPYVPATAKEQGEAMVASQPFSHGMQQAPLSVHAWLRWIVARDLGSEEETENDEHRRTHVWGARRLNSDSLSVRPMHVGDGFCFFLQTVIVSEIEPGEVEGQRST
ncbi:hypothetical protein LA080_015376 [Diaporthe eres]|nr:hypothetical protein LA080_015376 [Diaporthe eres]